VLNRTAWFDGIQMPVGIVQDLATLPENHGSGYERLLLSAADGRLHENHAVVGFARTDRPDVYRSADWIEVRGQRHTRANVSDILSKLASAPRSRRDKSLRIRLWRHVELEALRNVYRHAVESAWGPIERSEQYWRWLVSRKAHHEIIVAVHGKDQWEELDKPSNIVGYAVVRGSRVIELCTLPGHDKVAGRLLGRACQDAIEHDHRSLSLHIPTTDPLHELMLSAAGNWCCDARTSGSTWMLKFLDPARWIETMYPVLLRRAKATGVKRPCHLVFNVGQRKHRLELTRRSGRLVCDDTTATPQVRCSSESFAALLLGNCDIAAAQNLNQLEFADASAAFRVAALFSPAPFWQSQFDLLRF
jgi:predicted acetyltransferase